MLAARNAAEILVKFLFSAQEFLHINIFASGSPAIHHTSTNVHFGRKEHLSGVRTF
jgi:hypothetical protein